MSWNAMTSAEVCDIVDVTPASTEFLDDRFTLAVREGEARWGSR